MTFAQVGRFIMRDLHPWEGPALFKITGDPVVTQYLGFRTHRTEAEASELIAKYHLNEYSRFLAVARTEDPTDLVGVLGFEIDRHQVIVLIMFRAGWVSRGAGREVSRVFVDWLLSIPQIYRVWAYCHVDNVPVQRVLARMGAVQEGRLRRYAIFPNVSDEPQDAYVYSIVRN